MFGLRKTFLVFSAALLAQTPAAPPSTGSAGVLLSDGKTSHWGNLPTGPSGALDCVALPGVCDIVTAVVPLKATANNWTGANDFSRASFMRLPTTQGVPSRGCSQSNDVGKVVVRTDAKAPRSSVYVCAQTGDGIFTWELM